MDQLNDAVRRIKADTLLAAAVIAAWLIIFVVGPVSVRPWGEPANHDPDPGSFLTGVALTSDFVSFWTGAWMVRDGAGSGLYEMDVQHRQQIRWRYDHFGPSTNPVVLRHDPFHSPPPFALVVLPFTIFPISFAFVLWSALGLASLAGAVAIHLRGVPWAQTIVALMVASGFAGDMLFWGQVEGLFLLPLSLGLLALATGRPFLGGVLIGLLWLKPQYAVIFPLIFLVKRRWDELAGMIAAGIGVAIVSLVMVGINGVFDYVGTLREIGGFWAPPRSFVLPYIMVNWRATIMNLNPFIEEDPGNLLMLGLGALTILASLVVWRGRWDPKSARFGWQMLVAMAAIVVGTPHSHLHGVALLFAPLALVLARTDRTTVLWGALQGLLAVALFLSWAGWVQASARWTLAPVLLAGMAVAGYHLVRAADWPLRIPRPTEDEEPAPARTLAGGNGHDRRAA